MKDEYQYAYEWDSKYCYPNSFILINKLGIQDKDKLNEAERKITAIRLFDLAKTPVKGIFDLKHLQALHRYLFYDIYSWAGQLRTVNIAKGNQFCNCMYIESGFESIYEKLKKDCFLLTTTSDTICEKLAFYLGEINVVHPFREGNGRTQRVFIQYLAKVAGYSVNFSDVTAKEMIEASALAFDCDYHKMTELFQRITTPISAHDQKQFIHSIAAKGSPIFTAYEEFADDQEQTQNEDKTPTMKF
jgi:cell filamentation protein